MSLAKIIDELYKFKAIADNAFDIQCQYASVKHKKYRDLCDKKIPMLKQELDRVMGEIKTRIRSHTSEFAMEELDFRWEQGNANAYENMLRLLGLDTEKEGE